MFIGIFSRMIPFQALISAMPEVTKRGAFNAINASLQQFAGGMLGRHRGRGDRRAAGRHRCGHFNWLGYIVMAISLVSVTLMYFVHKQVPEKPTH